MFDFGKNGREQMAEVTRVVVAVYVERHMYTPSGK